MDGILYSFLAQSKDRLTERIEQVSPELKKQVCVFFNMY